MNSASNHHHEIVSARAGMSAAQIDALPGH